MGYKRGKKESFADEHRRLEAELIVERLDEHNLTVWTYKLTLWDLENPDSHPNIIEKTFGSQSELDIFISAMQSATFLFWRTCLLPRPTNPWGKDSLKKPKLEPSTV